MSEEIMPQEAGSISFGRALAALSCLLLATPLLNIVAFPLFDATFTYARDISVLACAVMLMLLACAAVFRPRMLRVRWTNRILVGALVTGSLLLVPALVSHSAPALVVASTLASIGRGWATLACGMMVARLEGRRVPLCVLAAFAIAYACASVTWFLPSFIGLMALAVGPLVALALSWPCAGRMLYRAEVSESPRDISVTQPASFLALSSMLFTSILLFKVLFGYALRFDVVDSNPVADWLIALAAIAVVLVIVGVRRAWGSARVEADSGRFPWDTLVSIAVLAAVAGLLCSMLPLAWAPGASTAALTAGSTLFELVSWSIILALAARSELGAVASIAWGRGVASIGSVVGAALGSWAGSSIGVDHVTVIVISAALVLVVTAYVLFGFRYFSFEKSVASVVPAVENARADAPQETLESRVAALAEHHGLTPREREVFEMLAHGRNREYIESKLVISRNTVKAHVKHIYAKLEVHSHQELLDLVEDASE